MDWSQWAVGVLGVLVGITATALFDAAGERRRRAHDRQLKLFDTGLAAGVDFLAAADRLRRSAEERSIGWMALDVSHSRGGEAHQETSDYLTAAQQRAADATTDAENAYNAMRLLIPAAADPVRRYLDLCGQVDVRGNEEKRKAEAKERAEAREQVETAVRRAVGGGLG